MSFKWHPDEAPPRIEAHSKAKLKVLRRYLRAYFDTLNVNPHREEFKLDLIDGFAGGGTFLDEDTVLSGTPLTMLEEATAAKNRLNQTRFKPLHIDCKFYFVDKEQAHTDHLRKALVEHGYNVDNDRIVVRNGLFENELEGILNSIRQRQPRSGRAIFLLDQTGFSQVELALVSRIFNELPAAEVILTFAADALVNHVAPTPQFETAVKPLQLSASQIQDLLRHKDGEGGRAFAQRLLRDQARFVTGATYDTPFFIRPEGIAPRAVVPPSVTTSQGSGCHDSTALGDPQHFRALWHWRFRYARLGHIEGPRNPSFVSIPRTRSPSDARAAFGVAPVRTVQSGIGTTSNHRHLTTPACKSDSRSFLRS
ncbi:MAG: three-Cys-motif partner protein TcmP [Deltaproteobacteria bacterium]|nr:three-Cys-motif partner protein TcmP [Deltaproteobacteria bacterium]